MTQPGSGPRRPPPRAGQYYDSVPMPSAPGGTRGSSGTIPSTPTSSSTAKTVRVPLRNPWGVADPTRRMGWNPDAFERFPEGSQSFKATDATDAWLNLAPGYRDWITSLAQHPNVGGRTGRPLWERAVGIAAVANARGDGTSPQQVLLGLASSLGIDYGQLGSFNSGSRGGFRGGYGGGGGSSTQQTIDLSSPSQARGLLMQTMFNVLGRDPNEEEYADFIARLNEAEQANPTVVSASGDTVTRSGGMDASVFAMDYAKSQEGFEDRQTNSYYKMFMNILSGGGA